MLNKITIYSDSQASIKSLEKLIPKSHIMQDIKALIFNNSVSVSLIWVRGHAGILGYELVDCLARNSIYTRNNILDIPLPPSHINNILKAKLIESWQADWEMGGGIPEG